MVDLDEDLLTRARAVLGTRTKKDTVNGALREVVEREERVALLDWMTSGAVDLEVLKDRDAMWRR